MNEDPTRRRGRAEPQDFLSEIGLDMPIALQNLLAEMRQQLQRLAVDPAPPAQVTGVTATAIYPGIYLQWNKAQKAAAYIIYRNTTGDLSTASQVTELPGSGNVSYFDVTQSLGATTVYYWIQAVNGIGIRGPVSIQKGALAPSAPSAGTITNATLDGALLANAYPDDDIPSLFGLIADVEIGNDDSGSVHMWAAITDDEDSFGSRSLAGYRIGA